MADVRNVLKYLVALSALALVIPGLAAAGPYTYPVINIIPPRISGTPQDGLVLTKTSNGTWSSPDALTYTNQWQRCTTNLTNSCTNIAGATGDVYRATYHDVNDYIVVVVTATDVHGNTGHADSNVLGPVAKPAPPVNTRRPVISGTPQDGMVLTKTSEGAWTSPDPLTYTDQWQRCTTALTNSCTNIPGATGYVYRAKTADVGHWVTVLVTATDKEGQTGQAAATPVKIGNPAPPVNTRRPVISGTPRDGLVLTKTSEGTWVSPDTLTFTNQWQRCTTAATNSCTNIPGATNNVYRATSADVGHYLTDLVTATDAEGQTGQAAATPLGPVGNPARPYNTSRPVISGTAQVGQVLTKISEGVWVSPDALTYTNQWERCAHDTTTDCTAIPGATGDVYRLTTADAGRWVTVLVTATDKEGQTGQAAATPIGPLAPGNTSPPVISGTPQDGQVLTKTSEGTWVSPDALTYTNQWQRCTRDTTTSCTNIPGATGNVYRLTSADVRDWITVVVTATDRESQTGQAAATPVGRVTDPAPPSNTSPPVISGTPQDGQVLTKTSEGAWTSPDALTYTNQWQRCTTAATNSCTNIPGATNNVYRATSADVGHYITVVVTAKDAEHQTGHAAAAPVGPVADPAPPSNTSRPVISGTPQDGMVLTKASNGVWVSPDRLSYTYQWQSCSTNATNSCTNILGATGSAYRARSGAVGRYMTVVVTAKDAEHQTGNATATPVGPVADPAPPSNTSRPVISGTPRDGQVLTKTSEGAWTSPDSLTYTDQWQRCTTNATNSCTDISGATGYVYRATSADVGDYLTVVVTAHDAEGQTGHADSNLLGPVAS